MAGLLLPLHRADDEMGDAMSSEPNPTPDRLDDALFEKRPLSAMRTGYGGAWLSTAWVFFAAIAIWIVLRPWITRLLWPPLPQPPRMARIFAAVAYEGISDKTNEVSPERFEDHLAALRAAGYVPIRLRDVEEFYREGRPLPEKALLLTLDQSRKTSYFAAGALLRRWGWNAVMFLWTRPIEEQDPAALLWPYVRNMARSEVWEIGAQSHDGFQRVVTVSTGRKGSFLTSPRWIEAERRYEEPDEFLRRLQADHERCWTLISNQLGVVPIAYAYPGGDFGQHQRRFPAASFLNTRLVAERYRLAFSIGELAYNTAHTHPLRLNRLRIRPEWTGRDLVDRLERSRPRLSPAISGGGVPDLGQWVADWGEAVREDRGALVLKATPGTTGARVWLLGSDLLEQVMIRLRFRLEEGQLAVHFRSSPDGDSAVCLTLGTQPGPNGNGGNGNGNYGAWLCQKRPDRPRFTLASAKVEWVPGHDYELELFVRDRYVSARLDGSELFREQTLLRGAPTPGLVGLSVWSPRPGRAIARVSRAEVREQTPTAVLWKSAVGEEGHLCRWVSRNAYRLTALSPLWLEGTGGGYTGAANLGFFKTLAAVHRLRFLPVVRISEGTDLRRLSAALLARRAVEEGVEALLVDLSRVERRAETTLAVWLHTLATALHADHIGLTLRLPAWIDPTIRWNAFQTILPGVTLAVATNESSVLLPGATTNNLPLQIEEVSNLSDEPLPPSYFIASEWGAPIETPEEKGIRLEQEGLNAFREGQYDRAIALWSEWRRLSPDLPRPYMLIGDALSRKGDLKGAIREYDRSLELDPGQISLVVRRAEFYSLMGMPAKARDSLNLYARLFPGNEEILRAQARWLAENNRPEEALALARQLLKRHPDDIEALVLCWRLSREPGERRTWIDRLTALADNRRYHLPLGQAIWKYALTAGEEAGPLHAAVEQIAAHPDDERIAELFGRLRRNPAPVAERFGPADLPSARWWSEGAVLVPAGKTGGVLFRAAETHTEGVLRLLGSLRLRHLFVEAVLGRVEGSCWLFACRSADHFARFGLSDDGYLRLQVWRGSRLAAEKKTPFERPSGPLRLRLEARSDGLIGYVNGEPAFEGSWLTRPSDLAFGWAGLAVYSPDKGRGTAELFELAGGALPLRAAVPQGGLSAEATSQTIESLRKDVALLQVVVFPMGTLHADGRWTDASVGETEREMFKLFARYHRLWFALWINCGAAETVRPEALEPLVRGTGADGVFLWVGPSWPDEPTRTAWKETFRSSPLRVLLVGESPQGSELLLETAGRGDEFTDGSLGAAQKFIRSDFSRPIPANVPLFLYY